VPFSRCVFNLLTILQLALFLGEGKLKDKASSEFDPAGPVKISISRQELGCGLWRHDFEGTYSCNVGWSAVLSWCTILYAISEYNAILTGSSRSPQPAGFTVSLVQAPWSRPLVELPLLHVFDAVIPTIPE